MSLISLLIALAAERYLSSPLWQFNTYYQGYIKFIHRARFLESTLLSVISTVSLILLPVAAVYGLLWLIDDSLLHLIFSTLILSICFGCVGTRARYKKYLIAAFRGEQTKCDRQCAELLDEKNLKDMAFGQTLVWLNYRYYIAIMLYFIVLGAPGVVLYRLVATLSEKPQQQEDDGTVNCAASEHGAVSISKAGINEESTNGEGTSEDVLSEEALSEKATNEDSDVEEVLTPATKQSLIQSAATTSQQLLFWLDWAPVRLTSFGYMLVGHFSKALPIWLENLFDFTKQPNAILIDVAQKSEDLQIDNEDCTAEPCLLVKLAKRNLLLLLAVISLLTLSGVLS